MRIIQEIQHQTILMDCRETKYRFQEQILFEAREARQSHKACVLPSGQKSLTENLTKNQQEGNMTQNCPYILII